MSGSISRSIIKPRTNKKLYLYRASQNKNSDTCVSACVCLTSHISKRLSKYIYIYIYICSYMDIHIHIQALTALLKINSAKIATLHSGNGDRARRQRRVEVERIHVCTCACVCVCVCVRETHETGLVAALTLTPVCAPA